MTNSKRFATLLGCLLASITTQMAAASGLRNTSEITRIANSSLPIYKNASYCVNERVEDLIQRMTIEEKAGLFWHGRLIPGPNGTLDLGNSERDSTEFMVGAQLISHFNLVGTISSARQSAKFHNRVQQYIIDNTRLGIPLSLSTDPRHAFTDNTGTGALAGKFSEWPEATGLAALRSVDLVRTFAEIAREEYLAVGIRGSLHPQVDLVTEPRWARSAATFGEDAQLTAELLVAYIKGFQGDKIGHYSVSTVTKHFPGGGSVEDGEDPHFTWGKNQTYPGNNFEHHLIPFKAAIAAGARQIMPYYSRPIGTQYPPVAFAFNKPIITGLLREGLGFEGIVVSDWYLITDHVLSGEALPARAWGVEYLSELERTQGVLDAGCDQFGGEVRPELLVQLVQEGKISEERLDFSARKLLREKYLLGLFDDKRFVDPEAAERVVGNDYFRRMGEQAQRRAYTLLTNKDNVLPLKAAFRGASFYIEGFNATFLTSRGWAVVDSPSQADYALLRLSSPSIRRPGAGGFSSRMDWGPLEFNATEQARQKAIYDAVPTIVDVRFIRPAAIPEIVESAAAVLGSYGSSTNAFLDVVFGVAEPEGRLPFDLPSSTAAVGDAMEDVPFDTKNPVFKFGHGLRYKSLCEDSYGLETKCSQ